MTRSISEAVRDHAHRAKEIRNISSVWAKKGPTAALDASRGTFVHWQTQALWNSMSSRMGDGDISEDEGILGIISMEHTMLGNPTTYVSPEIMDLLCHAAHMMEPEMIRREDLIAPNGMIVFGRPIVLDDPKYTTGSVGWTAVGWKTTENVQKADGTADKGVTLLLYSDGGTMAEAVDRILGNRSVEERETSKANLLENKNWLVSLDFHATSFSQTWTDADHPEIEGDLVAAPDVAFMRKFFLSLMRFCWQEILVRKPYAQEVHRSERRRVDREVAKCPWDGTVTTLVLRRSRRTSDGSSSTGNGLDHRILVRGYWRRQWYKELGEQSDPEARRQVYINPHIRGPEDGPLLIKHQVTAVVR